MARLHEANDQFHQAKLRLDGIGEMNAVERQKIAGEMRAAEREVEAVNQQIGQLLAQEGKPWDGGSAGTRGS